MKQTNHRISNHHQLLLFGLILLLWLLFELIFCCCFGFFFLWVKWIEFIKIRVFNTYTTLNFFFPPLLLTINCTPSPVCGAPTVCTNLATPSLTHISLCFYTIVWIIILHWFCIVLVYILVVAWRCNNGEP